ncbi:peptide chain release factor H [Sphingobacterium sp. 2149]|uniref:peptide chain release factor H n=1 Tax=Sphingobacterium sp. 2149 TaxID=2817763 RepID=UPI001AE3696C|nr:peptide chain release factor H [Sphingobacterium sp. 2149]MDR6736177.1 peptide chain release factor [Sphingobacterium sp. 2149]
MMEEKYLQVTSGRGPKECNLAVRLVASRITLEASKVGAIAEELETEEIDGLPCSSTFRLRGNDLDQLLDKWIGTVCWVCKSPFRPLHKRKNWFVEVKPYSPVPKEDVLHLKDVYFQAMRSSGAGGQHVNKVSSAVRATHVPSGISVQVMDTRSQLQNKEIALLRLAERLRELSREELNVANEQKWKNQIEVKRGQAKRVFHGPNFIEK